MLYKIASEVELDLLELLGIELKGGKLIKVSTGEVFQQVKSDKPYERKYECGNTLINFHIYLKNDEIMPISVTVQDGKLEYVAANHYSNSIPIDNEYGRVLRINYVGEHKNEVIIEPQFYSSFMKTVLHCSNPYLDGITIDCSFDKICVYSIDSYFYPGELSKENYEKILYYRIDDLFRDEIKEAYHKCMPFFMKGYEKLEYYPVEYKEDFKNGFNGKIASINKTFVNDVKKAMIIKESSVKDGLEILKDKGIDSTICQAEIYFKAFTEYENSIEEYMEKRDEDLAKIEKIFSKFIDYVEFYDRNHEQKSK